MSPHRRPAFGSAAAPNSAPSATAVARSILLARRALAVAAALITGLTLVAIPVGPAGAAAPDCADIKDGLSLGRNETIAHCSVAFHGDATIALNGYHLSITSNAGVALGVAAGTVRFTGGGRLTVLGGMNGAGPFGASAIAVSPGAALAVDGSVVAESRAAGSHAVVVQTGATMTISGRLNAQNAKEPATGARGADGAHGAIGSIDGKDGAAGAAGANDPMGWGLYIQGSVHVGAGITIYGQRGNHGGRGGDGGNGFASAPTARGGNGGAGGAAQNGTGAIGITTTGSLRVDGNLFAAAGINGRPGAGGAAGRGTMPQRNGTAGASGAAAGIAFPIFQVGNGPVPPVRAAAFTLFSSNGAAGRLNSLDPWHTVTFRANAPGVSPASYTVAAASVAAAVAALPAGWPSRAGDPLTGWVREDGTLVGNVNAALDADVTLKASWASGIEQPGGGDGDGDNGADAGNRPADPPPAAVCAPFPDVTAANTHCRNIEWLAGRGITKPVGGKYLPGGAVTRGSMATFLYRLVNPGRPVPTCRVKPFPDVAVGHVHCGAIAWAVREGITVGYADGTYRPGSAVTRGSMATFLYRVAGSPAAPACRAKPFDDVPAAHTHCKTIAWAKADRITTGLAGGQMFAPERTVNRDQMASFLKRIDDHRR